MKLYLRKTFLIAKYLLPILVPILTLMVFFTQQTRSGVDRPVLWEFQSIDTVKYSRDLSREKLNDPDFDKTIEQQVQKIAQLGATHVAIGTPYDEEFLPMLKKWVAAARKYQLNVWFRGNWSGWEKWFGYPAISRGDHLAKTKAFILDNKDLFQDGDIFTACPECENGGPGDPRMTGDINRHRDFLLKEYQATKEAFGKINKNVKSNFDSMNGDVASLIMDKPTTKALDGLVVIDHYVSTPEKMAQDIKSLSESSGGKIILGEFGAPVPSVNGTMDEVEQARFVDKVFRQLYKNKDILGGVNYWVAFGGTTSLFDDDGSARLVAGIVKKYYIPAVLVGTVTNTVGDRLGGIAIKITDGPAGTFTGNQGTYGLTVPVGSVQITVSGNGYVSRTEKISLFHGGETPLDIVLEPQKANFIYKLRLLIGQFFKDLFGF